nr:MAG TPA: hypothetical protein [Crassvirales sp.]
MKYGLKIQLYLVKKVSHQVLLVLVVRLISTVMLNLIVLLYVDFLKHLN